MDKLQPILAQKYWIVFVAAMILPTTGWWIGAANVQGETETATTAAKSAFDSVPPKDSPNGTFPESVQHINDTLKKNNEKYNDYLYVTQRNAQFWPASINDAMQQLPYKANIPNQTLSTFRRVYFVQLYDTPQILDPLTEENPSGNVYFDLLNVFSPQFKQADWHEEPPDSETVWDVQEDLWLLRALLGAVAETNRGYPDILQAPIKEIVKIELRGGTADDESTEVAGTAVDGGGETEDVTYEDANEASYMGSGTGNGQEGGKGSFASGGVAFDLAEVFGSDAVKAVASASAESGTPGEAPMEGVAEVNAFNAFKAYDAAGAAQNQAKRRRYINDVEGAPFKTRGFYLQVVIEHKKLLDLMAHLASLDWPVEIVRVQQQIKNPDRFRHVAGRGQGTDMPGGPAFGRRGAQGSGFGGGGGGRFPIPGLGGTGESIVPMGVVGPMDPRSQNRVEQEKAAEAGRNYTAAMLKPGLVEVAIAGKFTLFQPPPVDESADGTETEPEAETTEEPSEPAASPGNAPANDAPAGVPPANSTPRDENGSVPQETTKPAANDDQPATAVDTANPAPTATPTSGGAKTEAAQAEKSQAEPKQPE